MGYFSPYGIGLLDLAEQFRCIRELRLELFANFRAHFITAAVNAGTNRGLEISRPAAESAAHLSHALLDDPFDSAPPARVKHAHGAVFGVDENDGQAIGGLNTEQQAWSRCNQAIAG